MPLDARTPRDQRLFRDDAEAFFLGAFFLPVERFFVALEPDLAVFFFPNAVSQPSAYLEVEPTREMDIFVVPQQVSLVTL